MRCQEPVIVGWVAERLVGRDEEVSSVQQALQDARRMGAGLLVDGDAGIGKSALVHALCEEATAAGFTVVSCRPGEFESSFAYTALADLVGDLYGELGDTLPGPQRDALARLLHLDRDDGAGTTADAVAAATTSLLRTAARRGPLCIVVDDVQWIDTASRQALAFAIRRLQRAGVLIAVAHRTGEEGDADPLGMRRAFVDGRLVELSLGGLSSGAMHALLHRTLGLSLSRARIHELHDLTRGNPLHALEVGRAVLRRGALKPGQALPVAGSLTHLLSARIRGATRDAIQVLDVVALAERPTPAVLDALLGGPEKGRAALDAAFTAELVELDGDRICPTHPLLTAVAREAMPPGRRRDLHQRLAEVEDDPDARIRHRARAVDGADRDLAAALEGAAARARARGAPDAAAELLGMAVVRTPARDGIDRDRRRLLEGEALFDAGDLARARAVADELFADTVAPEFRGRLALLRGTIAWYLEPSDVAVGHLEQALEVGIEDAATAGRLHMHLTVFADWDAHRARAHAVEAVRLLEPGLGSSPDHDGTLAAALCQLFYAEVLLGMEPRVDLLAQALAIEPETGKVDRSTVPGLWWAATDDLDAARARFEIQLHICRETGDLSGEADLLKNLALVALMDDAFDEAARLADEAITVWQQQGQAVPEAALRTRAWVDAHRGELDRAETAASDALARLEGTRPDILVVAWLGVLALVAATRGDAATVEAVTARAAEQLASIGIADGLHLDPSSERVAALCHLGRVDEARVLLEDLAARNERAPRHVLAVAIARGRALLASAEGRTTDAIQATDMVPGTDRWPAFERGRTLLLRGQLQRRIRDRRGARESVEEALELFNTLGARAWADQCEAELARLGRFRPGTLELTPTEEKVADLAASGLSTREVAARLFVSPKTVESHLTHIYGKLGIASRAELGARMASRPRTQQPGDPLM